MGNISTNSSGQYVSQGQIMAPNNGPWSKHNAQIADILPENGHTAKNNGGWFKDCPS